MMVHDTNQDILATRPRKRIGRGVGSGHGKTSGRGHKGAGSRSGYSRALGFEGGQKPLMRRVAKRGFNNNYFATEISEVNVCDLNRFEAGSDVTLELLTAKGLVSQSNTEVKILGNGEVSRALTIHAHRFSKSAEMKLIAAGCKIVFLS